MEPSLLIIHCGSLSPQVTQFEKSVPSNKIMASLGAFEKLNDSIFSGDGSHISVALLAYVS